MDRDISHAINYHEATKHSEASLATSRHSLDFANKPIPFKVYLELPSITLPKNFPTPEAKALSCMRNMAMQGSRYGTRSLAKFSENTNLRSYTRVVDLADVAEILFFSAGLTREMKYPHGNYYMRAASATGALYPIELYLVCDDLSSNLTAGVYHFSPASFTLTQIREGSYKNYLAATTANNNNDIANSAFVIVLTSFAWRNAWKYQARSYRHWFWDSGVIIANLLATTNAMGVPARLVMGFIDDDLNRLLCLEEQKESSIVMVAIGEGGSDDNDVVVRKQHAKVETLSQVPIPEIRPLSRKGEVNYPQIWDLNQASKLTSKQDIIEWIHTARRDGQLKLKSTILNSPQKNDDAADKNNRYTVIAKELDQIVENSRSLKETILWRGSSRRFARTSISFSALKAILYFSMGGIPMDFLQSEDSLIDIYFIANAVNDLNPGAYYYNRNTSATNSNPSIDKVKEIKNSRNISSYLCLGQSLFRDASVVFFLMTNLQSVLKSLGNRGYRASQFEAGIIAGRIYLSAYAIGIGASGSTFFDDAVTEFLSPHAREKSTMIAVGVGVPAYKAKPGALLPVTLTKEQLLTEDFL
ncbi:MAG: SagB/ThcOx family dehydrogenase [Thermoproteota archaeon]|nr:SagB/ThcOx family dehydrogenase [Thermoproteota archaeon]